jgi:hypothetical protein
MGDGGGDIIIKGSSVHLNYDGTIYQKDPADPQHRRHDGRKITRVKVEDENGNSLLDETDDAGLKWTITVSTAAK